MTYIKPRWMQRLPVALGLGLVLSVLAVPAHTAEQTSNKKKATVAASKPRVAVKKVANAKVVAQRKKAASPSTSVVRVQEPAHTNGALSLNSNAALVVDQNTQEVLFSKNEKAVMPIASITKLMTGMLVADAKLPMDEEITITQDDVDTYKGTGSRLAVGTRLNRGELMHLALMSSENRAAHALGRTYPGGLDHFVGLMNQKAAELGMRDTRYVEPTGLSSSNQSSARDLAILVGHAYQRPLLRELTTSPGYTVEAGRRMLQYRNSNRLVDDPHWNINLQKTGYISEAGRCLVMSVSMAGRQVIMVFLDAAGKAARITDAQRVRRWVEDVIQSEQRENTMLRKG